MLLCSRLFFLGALVEIKWGLSKSEYMCVCVCMCVLIYLLTIQVIDYFSFCVSTCEERPVVVRALRECYHCQCRPGLKSLNVGGEPWGLDLAFEFTFAFAFGLYIFYF